MIKTIVISIIIFVFAAKPLNSVDAFRVDNPDRIVGKWITKKRNLIVEVYKIKDEYRAKVVWFSDKDDMSKPMNTRTDINNPETRLRNRKLIGLEVLKMLRYNPNTDSWEGGVIYDSLSGKEWSAYAFFTEERCLRVKGYWQLKFICKSLDFLPYKG